MGIGEKSVDKIDITMTAVLRPAVLDKSLASIVKNLVKDQNRFRLIINVDPIGEDVDPMAVVEVARKHFDNVIYNIPSEPSFPKAVKWIWLASEAPYVFHWEDDVSLLREIDIDDMIRIHKKYLDVAALRLYIRDTPKKKVLHIFRSNWRYNKDGFYIADNWQEQFGLNPNLIKKEFIKEAVHILRDDINPEKVFRVKYAWSVPLISKWKYGLYTNPGNKITVSGLNSEGHVWRRQQGLDKPVGKHFLTWAGGKKRKNVESKSNKEIEMSKTVLVVAAHFDDVEVGVGGTILKHIECNHSVYIAVLDSGEFRTGKPKVRKQEQLNSLSVMGLDKSHLLLFTSDEDEADVMTKLDKVRPDIIYTLYEKDTHQAHRKASCIGQSVGRKKHITTIFYDAGSAYEFYPNVFSIIDFKKKSVLIKCFQTQLECGAINLDRRKKLESYWASLVTENVNDHAEGFIIRKMIYEV